MMGEYPYVHISAKSTLILQNLLDPGISSWIW